MYMCFYYNKNYKNCNFFLTSQDQSQRDNYCLTSSNWKNCANYTSRSYVEKVTKTVNGHSNLDL